MNYHSSSNYSDIVSDCDYYSDSDSDYDSDNSYDSENEHLNNHSKYNLVLCELYNTKIHGIPHSPDVLFHYLVIIRLKKYNYVYIDKLAGFYNLSYQDRMATIRNIDTIRNYSNIINNKNYIKPEIAECLYLKNGECICIIKTFWLRLVQRRWKSIYKQKQNIIKKRMTPSNISYRKLKGTWPQGSIYLPGLKGMMCCYSKQYNCL